MNSMDYVGLTNIFEKIECVIDGAKHIYYENIDAVPGFYYTFGNNGECFVALSGKQEGIPLITKNSSYIVVNFKTLQQLSNENNHTYDYDMFKKKYQQNIGKYYTYDPVERLYNIITDEQLIENINKNKNVSKIPKNLLKYGEVLTDKKYYSDPAIVREKEIELVELGLLTPKKSPLLVGLSGVGKTAIAEGLAYKIQMDNVPTPLKNKTIFNVEPAALISGCQNVGMVEENVKELIDGIKCKEDIILFIDEFHTLIGLGMGSNSNIDVSNMLKPYLASGEIKIIGSTTLEEYNNIVLKDKAFARRFKLIDVVEPKLENVIKILFGSIPYYEQTTGVTFDFCDEDKQIIFECISNLTEQENRIQKRYYPDITLEIFSEFFGYARLNSREQVNIDDIISAISICNTVNEQSKNDAIEYLNNSFKYQKKLEFKK